MVSLGMAFPFIRFLSFAICALKRRNDAKIWVDFMKTNYSLIMRTALGSLFAALQTRPQLSKERIVISHPADIIAIQRTTYFDLHHFGCSKLGYIVSSSLVSFAAARAGVTQRSPSPRVGTGSVA